MPKSSGELQKKTTAIISPETLIQILFVDDEKGFLKSAKQILELHGSFQIETALSVKEAKKKLEQKQYDVIVSDYLMPETDGLEFLKELRDNRNDTPFILFTGKGKEDIAIEALNLGADRYFNKAGKPETVYGELAHSITTAVKANRAEKTLQESEEKYRKQFEKAIDAIFLADAKTGILVDCNRAATELIGRKKSGLIGKHQRILHPPELEEGEFSRAFEQHRKEKEAQVVEDRVITKSGEIRDVIISATRFTVEGRKFLQGTFRDITEKKKTEKQLRQERETLENVTENIGAGLTIISKDYKILWANNFLKNVFGNIKGKTCYSVYNDRTSICPGCGVKKIFETNSNQVVHEQSVPGPDGQRVWIEITANPIRDENGSIVAASELSVVVHERKQLERKLRDAEKRYHAIFDKSPVGILILDSSGTPVEFNEQAHRQLGYSREEFGKLTVSDHEVLETPEETRARINKILKTGKDEFETKHRTKTGEIRDIKNVVQVIELSGQKYFQVITQDITEQKKAEEALQENEKKYRALLNGMNDTAWVVDADCNILDVNDAAVKA
ncbi:MAG: PAS domain S-box protein, partial [Candidatus Bathyarchaeota archaeon]